MLLVELLEAKALDAIDPLGGCNPYAVLQIGPHEVREPPHPYGPMCQPSHPVLSSYAVLQIGPQEVRTLFVRHCPQSSPFPQATVSTSPPSRIFPPVPALSVPVLL